MTINNGTFQTADLITLLNTIETNYPLCTITKTNNQTGDLYVHDATGNYIGIIDLWAIALILT